MQDDPRLAAARYRARGETPPDDAETRSTGATAPTGAHRAAYVETALQQAMRRGDFDDLPGAGKPLPDLGGRHDPDWWIRRKIQTEQLSGLGPPALTLRVEDAQMRQSLDALGSAEAVRDAVEDFNRRVIEARRQLLGGPPVVTGLRDVDAEVTGWHERRTAAASAARVEASPPSRRRRWLRGRSAG
jgi:hypothetical protein